MHYHISSFQNRLIYLLCIPSAPWKVRSATLSCMMDTIDFFIPHLKHYDYDIRLHFYEIKLSFHFFSRESEVSNFLIVYKITKENSCFLEISTLKFYYQQFKRYNYFKNLWYHINLSFKV